MGVLHKLIIMIKIGNLILVTMLITLPIAAKYLPRTFALEKQMVNNLKKTLLSDPFLQLPTENTVNVVWFTEFLGDKHWVEYGAQLHKKAIAKTTKLSHVREDSDSKIDNPPTQSTSRDIWRHEAVVTGLIPNQRVSYRVKSESAKQTAVSNTFTLASNPSSDAALKILLTSDHQLMPMTTANLTKVVETVDRLDAVFFPGDLVNVPDRASEWFDDLRGGSFFS